jgi:hypothetical protein
VLLNAERSFRRLKGHPQMQLLVAALARHIEAVTRACDTANVAWRNEQRPSPNLNNVRDIL